MAARDRPEDREAAEDDGFLRRWSRRKAETRRGGEPTAPDEADAGRSESDAAAPATVDPEDLPDIESLTRDSDFKVFMQKGVPAHLRTLALRKLWRLNPKLANLDGLIDYGEDFTDAARVVPDLKSAYQAGRGFLKKIEGTGEVTAEDARVAASNVQGEKDAGQEDAPAPEAAVERSGAPSVEGPETPQPSPRRTPPASRGTHRRPLPKRG